jgi:hypothetical protein
MDEETKVVFIAGGLLLVILILTRLIGIKIK